MTTAASLNVRQLEKAFGVSNMTLYNWRKGTPTKSALPYYSDGVNISFKLNEVRSWAKENGVAFDARKLNATSKSKPGPKARSRRSNGKSNKH